MSVPPKTPRSAEQILGAFLKAHPTPTARGG